MGKRRHKTIIRNCHPELVSGSMSYRKSEMLKKFQHDTNIAKVSIFDYGLWTRAKWLLISGDLCYYEKWLYLVEEGNKDSKYCDLTKTGGRR